MNFNSRESQRQLLFCFENSTAKSDQKLTNHTRIENLVASYQVVLINFRD